MSSGKAQSNAFQNAANTASAAAGPAIAKAQAPDPLEQEQRDQTEKLFKWSQGQLGPIDVRNMPGGGVNMALYQDALKVHDADRIGKGYGTLTSDANPGFATALNQENEMTRGEQASGALEQNVNDTINQNNAEMGVLGQEGNQRNQFGANLLNKNAQDAQNRVLQWQLGKPKNFFQQLATSFAGGAGQALASYI